MRTQKQIEASRWNGQKSRGPVSSQGKRVSSQNSFKTGLYSQALVTHGEKREDFETLRGEYYARHSPQTPEERETLDIVILLAWQLRRYGMVETHSWNLEIRRAELHAPANMLEGNLYGSAFFGADQRFARIHRMQAATQRNFKNALQDLELLKAARPAQPVEEEDHFTRSWVRSVNPGGGSPDARQRGRGRLRGRRAGGRKPDPPPPSLVSILQPPRLITP